jgi:hypothetical protein
MTLLRRFAAWTSQSNPMAWTINAFLSGFLAVLLFRVLLVP